MLVLQTEAHSAQVPHAVTIPGIKAVGNPGDGEEIDVEYQYAGPMTGIRPKDNRTTLSDRVASAGDWQGGKDHFYGSQ